LGGKGHSSEHGCDEDAHGESVSYVGRSGFRSGELCYR
jgi:hypothetical protein